MKLKIKRLTTFLVCILLSLSIFSTLVPNVSAKDTSSDLAVVAKQLKDIRKDFAKIELKKELAKSTVKELKQGKAVANFAKTTIPSVVNLVEDWENADYIGEFYGILQSGVKLAATCVGFGGVADAVFGIFDSVMSIGENSESELEQLESRLNDQFELVNENIDEVQRDIAALSQKTDESTQTILTALDGEFDAYHAKTQLSDFISGRSGNFNYKQFKNYLFGSTDSAKNPNYYQQAYYNILIESINNNADEDVIKHNYDMLYRSLKTLDIHGDSSINLFMDYLMDDGINGEKSIQKYYYDCVLINEDILNGESAEESAITFALDLYTTALFADYCLGICSTYQTVDLLKTYGAELNADSKYYFGSGDTDYITYGDILKLSGELSSREEQLTQQFLNDVAYIFNIDGSFTTEWHGDYFISSNRDVDTFGNVVSGQTLYLNKLSDEICEIFDFDQTAFSYMWSDGEKTLSTNEIYTVDGNTPQFTATVSYNGVQLYSIDFYVAESIGFSGGSGTKTDPYLISSAEQMYFITQANHGYEKHYKLIDNVVFGAGVNFSPIGSEEYPFEGSFDGSGYTIENLTISGAETASLFGVIGVNAEVRGITIKNGSFTVNGKNIEKATFGAIASICYGSIYDCHLLDSIITFYTNADIVNKNINVFVGGIAGESSGDISYCSVRNTTITAETERDYQSNSDASNRNNCYVGAIVSNLIEPGTIQYCLVDSATKLSGYVESKLFNNMTSSHPYVNVYVGGIAAKGSATSVSKVYSAATIEKCAYYAWNSSVAANNFFNNCHKKQDIYIPEISENQRDAIYVSETDIQFPTNSEHTITYFYNTLTNENYGYCYDGQLYSYGEKSFKYDDLKVKVDDVVVPFRIINHYGFDTINPDVNNSNVVPVTLLLWVDVNGEECISKLEIPITVKENAPTGIEVSIPTYLEKEKYNGKLYPAYNQNDSILSKGESVKLLYQDGSTADITDKCTVADNHLEIGKNTITIQYGEFSCEYEVVVRCSHNYIAETIVPTTCTHYGYTEYVCANCEDSYIADIVLRLNHSPKLVRYEDATCKSKGYTGDLICGKCNELLEQGTETPILPHKYGVGDSTKEHHFCYECNTNEVHHFSTVENDLSTILYVCSDCGYYDTETKDLSKLARVIVSDSYAIAGKEAVVYVQILNSPGITGASLSINYNPELELVTCEQDSILPDAPVFTVTHVRPGLSTVTTGRAKVDTSEYGNLLKLVFKVPENADLDDEYIVSIAYSLSGEQFTDKNANGIDILTIAGVVTVVDWLPGDVNGDQVLDILDAILISLACNNVDGVNDELLQNANYNKAYSDIDLSGIPGLGDIVRMLQYFVGGYDSQILANNYKIHLNFNDGEREPEIITVTCFDENGNRNFYGDILPVPEREGYKFDGWYTKAVDGKEITSDSKITYNNDQYDELHKQMLYAHWTLNEISFDGNGATAGGKDTVTYFNYGDDVLVLGDYFDKVAKVTLVCPEDNNKNKTIDLEYTFWGWATKKNDDVVGDVVYNEGDSIPLSGPESLGDITLYAVWKDLTINLSKYENDFKRSGHDFVGWYSDSDRTKLVAQPDTKAYEITGDTRLYARYDFIEYTIKYDANGGTGTMSERIIDNPGTFNLDKIAFTRTGYTFDVAKTWNTKADGSGTYYSDLQSITAPLTASSSITLYAQWSVKSFKISWNNPTGATITVNRTYSPHLSSSDTIPLKSGDTVYYGDKLEISYSLSDGYKFVNINVGTKIIEKVTGNITNDDIYEATEKIKYIVNLNANTTTNSNMQSSKCYANVELDQASQEIYPADLSKDIYISVPYTKYYNFDGWWTSENGGTQITDKYGKVLTTSGITNGKTLFAHWTKTYSNYTYVKNVTDLNNIRNKSSAYYLLIDNISVGSMSPIDTFSGILDGDGHTISNWKYNNSSSGNVGMFRINKGTITNVIFDSCGIGVVDGAYGNLNVGIVCGTNEGIIEFVTVKKADVKGDMGSIDTEADSGVSAGGICGRNTWKIRNSGVINSSIYAYSGSASDGGTANAWAGGVVGVTQNTSTGTAIGGGFMGPELTDVFSHGNDVTAIAKGKKWNGFLGIGTFGACGWSCSGGISGRTDGNIQMVRCLGYANDMGGSYFEGKDGENSRGSLIGRVSNALSCSNCYSETADTLVGSGTLSGASKVSSLTDITFFTSNSAFYNWKKSSDGHFYPMKASSSGGGNVIA